MYTPSFQPDSEFLELLSQFASGSLTDAGSTRLQSLLSSSPEHRRFYRRYLQADTALRESACSAVRLASPTQAPLREPWYWKAAAAIATLACITSLWFARPSFPENTAQVPTLAILTQSVGVQWKSGGRTLQSGTPLSAGTIAFDRGLIQLEFMNGAVVVAEGPAELELLSPSRAICRQGKIRASVPPQAHGFTITAPDMDVVDLGTEFGLAVGSDGKSQVHVIDGEVRMEPKGAAAKRSTSSLFAGQGLQWQAGLLPATITGNASVFTSRKELLALSSQSSRETLARWQTESARVRDLPETVFHYTFEPKEPWSRTLTNTRPNTDPGLNGAVVGCQWTQGRWPGKHALEFKGPSDRIRVHIPGEYTAVTLAAWVRIEGWDRWLSSLLLTDAFKKGAIHWQLSDKGEIILGVHPGRLENHFSPPVIGPNDLGRWVFLATTYDEANRTVTHYLDGRKVGTTSIQTLGALAPGDAELGNWISNQTSGSRTRSLNGRMDEFTFYSRALTSDEVRAAYEKGLPR